ncbi:glycosyltransferase [Candidatus Roseilinea sp. NK_OTU-006]|uniref:glycosyltransferase n=1 Tax=Candidatus Roseilinea sp. NK_OTU-006 TaxID=2704250 RepID=UPI00145F1953|nr:glycosyltransferase [Candidatus Roseilinea sp. NK_OTU-006]
MIGHDSSTPPFPMLLSVVCVLRNQAKHLEELVCEVSSQLASLVTDYEFIVVDNASEDDSMRVLKRLTSESGYPNLQVYALTKAVDDSTACWAGIENALGDFVAVLDPLVDDIRFLPTMLERAADGADVVFARNQQKPQQGFAYRIASSIFNLLYRLFNGVDLSKEAPSYRLLSRRVVNFILRHPQPVISYRYLPATSGFARVNLEYSAAPRTQFNKKLSQSIEQGIRLIFSTTRTPMRMVTSLSLFGAVANLLYSIYVVLIGIFKRDVAPGWISLSLQQSGMFFLLSLVLLVLGEYILNMVRLNNEGPPYHVSQELTSARLTRKERLNVEEAEPQPSNRLQDARL